MKAAVFQGRNAPEMLAVKEVARPEPGEGQVLVQVAAASVNAADVRSMRMGIVRKGRIMGADIAGRIEAVGGNAARFRRGEEVLPRPGKGRRANQFVRRNPAAAPAGAKGINASRLDRKLRVLYDELGGLDKKSMRYPFGLPNGLASRRIKGGIGHEGRAAGNACAGPGP